MCSLCLLTFRHVGRDFSQHTAHRAGGIPRWVYHVSQLLHHTLHHLRPVLQQLRGELLVQPSLRVTHRNTQLWGHCRQPNGSHYMSSSHYEGFTALPVLCNGILWFKLAHFFQFGDQLRRGHNILLTFILVDVAAVIRQSVRHILSLRSDDKIPSFTGTQAVCSTCQPKCLSIQIE